MKTLPSRSFYSSYQGPVWRWYRRGKYTTKQINKYCISWCYEEKACSIRDGVQFKHHGQESPLTGDMRIEAGRILVLVE